MSFAIKVQDVHCFNRCCIYINNSVIQTSDGELIVVPKKIRFVARNHQLIPETVQKTKKLGKNLSGSAQVNEYVRLMNQETLAAYWEELIREYGKEFVAFAVAYLEIQYFEKLKRAKPLKAKDVAKIQKGVQRLAKYAPIIKLLTESAFPTKKKKRKRHKKKKSFREHVREFTQREKDVRYNPDTCGICRIDSSETVSLSRAEREGMVEPIVVTPSPRVSPRISMDLIRECVADNEVQTILKKLRQVPTCLRHVEQISTLSSVEAKKLKVLSEKILI